MCLASGMLAATSSVRRRSPFLRFIVPMDLLRFIGSAMFIVRRRFEKMPSSVTSGMEHAGKSSTPESCRS